MSAVFWLWKELEPWDEEPGGVCPEATGDTAGLSPSGSTVHALHFNCGDWLLQMHFLLIKMLKIKLHVKRFVKI